MISLFVQGFFEFLIAAILTSYSKDYGSFKGELISLGIAYFSYFVTLVFLPFASLYIICQSHERINEENFKARWGELYQNMYEKRTDRAARTYYLWFLVRRIIFILMSFGMYD